MKASDVTATIALVVSAIGGVLGVVSIVLSFRESGRREEEIGFLRREGERREEELGLLRQGLAEERAEREKLRRAKLIAERGGAFSSEHKVEYEVTLTNTGPHIATEIAVWIEDGDGNRIGNPAKVASLMVGASAPIALHAPPQSAYLGPYGVFIEWWDGRGYQSETNVLRLDRL